MSRVGKQILTIPEKTTAVISGGVVTVKGPKGETSKRFADTVKVAIEGNKITATPTNNSMQAKMMWGTAMAHIKNMLSGVNHPFTKKLLIEGVGFRAELAGKDLKLALGFSHPVLIRIPDGVAVSVEKGVISISGIDKEIVGQFAATIRSHKKPEPYKGKGIRYENEVIRRKQGKKTVG
ncbi:MAG: 50S ribosomal protein L6 [Candidatus Lloydbacteria bacterium]|nr:50S ribosomal protein L6 [Candidatus Lloydbacteria bacterium]